MANLNDILGPIVDGRRIRLSDESLSRVLMRDYIANTRHEKRRNEAKLRLGMYRDMSLGTLESDIDAIFKNAKVRSWRKAFGPFSLWQNSTKRIIRETSAVYSERAERKVKSGAERYRKLQMSMHYDRHMRKVNRYTNLFNACLVRPDINLHTGAPMLRVTPPDRFWAIAHPQEPLTCVGFIVMLKPPPDEKAHHAHYLVLDEESHFKLNKAGHVLPGRTKHGIGKLPGILVQREPPDDELLDMYTGGDLISAHRTVAMLITMMLKHQKSGTKQPYASGDVSSMANGQPMDEEHLMVVPEGVSMATLDLGADPSKYLAAIKGVLQQIAANYGIPASVYDLSYQATSGFEIQLKRSALREIRNDQIIDYRPVEFEVADLLAEVLRVAKHPMRYSMKGWGVNFGELEVPANSIDTLVLWEKLESLDLISRVQMYRELNPEATIEEAIEIIDANRKLKVDRAQAFQSKNSGSFGLDNKVAKKEEDDEEDDDEMPVAA